MSAQIIGGRWEIAGVIGEGGMGDVYRGFDLETGEAVAIKLLKPDIVDAMPELIDRFKREVALLHQLDHPNIVRILGALEEDDLHYLIMEYVPGGSLKDLIAAQGRLSVDRAMEIALDLTDALTRAHRLRIVHRDLKPANVLMAEDGTPRLTDFGIARVGDSTTMTQSGALIGTMGYLSPEACRGQPLDARSEIWSFGVLVVEMLTGANPFRREFVAATLTAILHEPVPDLETARPDAPVALIDLIYRMLEKDPDYRISSMRVVGAELEALLTGDDPPLDEAMSGAVSVRRRHSTGPLSAGVLAGITPGNLQGPVRAIMRHDLATQPTPFVGREADLEALARLADRHRLVTVAAPGGMGKTRLAAEYASRQVGKYLNGVYFISLGELSRAEDVLVAVADAVRFSFAPVRDREEQLLSFLAQPDEGDMLLVFDNFEHLLDAAPLLSAIMRAAPGIRIMTTSRERLNLSGEVVFELGGMELPDGLTVEEARQHGTVQLFVQNARRVQPGFDLAPADVPHVLRICHSVFGNPLGIVLAAAWAEMLTVEEIAHEVAISLDFLQTDARDVPERQRSLRAVFESSWNMLTDTERDVFMKLSIFQGGVKRTVAQYITRASLQMLAALVKKSLLRRDADSGRYQVHELLRQYAAEELERSGQAAATRDVHCYYFMSLVARHTDELRGGGQGDAIREIDADFENVRSAWLWAVRRKNAAMIEMGLEGLFLFCYLTGEYDELAGLLRAARDALAAGPGDPPTDLWRRVAIRCELAQTPHGDPAQIARVIELAQAAHDLVEEAFGLWVRAYWISGQGEHDIAAEVFMQAVAAVQATDDTFLTGRIMGDAGLFLAVAGRHAESVELLYQAGQLQARCGDEVGVAQSMLRMALNVEYLTLRDGKL